MNIVVGLTWAILAMVRLRQGIISRDALPLLLALQAGLVTWAMITRRESAQKAPREQEITAWISAILPFAIRLEKGYQWGLDLLAMAGIALSVVVIKQLDRSFGVAPADRGLVERGIYRVIRHPMYLGELLALLGAAFSWLTLWNGLIVLAQLGLTVLRIRWEENIVEGYDSYKTKVKWRLIPLVW